MSTESIDHATITTKANVYFDGKCVSHALRLPDGGRKSVGVVLPSLLTFGTDGPEEMECVAGACEYRLAGASDWSASTPGHRFSVAANSKFELRVAQAYHYICHYG